MNTQMSDTLKHTHIHATKTHSHILAYMNTQMSDTLKHNTFSYTQKRHIHTYLHT